jgi:site-specific recombinase XerD
MELINMELTKTNGLAVEISQNGNRTTTLLGEDIIEAYLSTLNSDNTRDSFRRAINSFFSTLYPNDILTAEMMIINPAQAQGYALMYKNAYRNKEIMASTYNSKIKGIKYFYDWLIVQTTLNTMNMKIFNVNPFAQVKLISESDSVGSMPLEIDEVILMLANPYGHNDHIKERNSLLLEMAITTGIRRTAITSITINNIKKIGNNWVLEVMDKGNKRDIKSINNYYDRLIKWYNHDKLFRTPTEDKDVIFNISDKTANRIIKTWVEKVGINKDITFHSLRVTTAIEIFKREGNNIFAVQSYLNHSSANTSKIYVDKMNTIKTAGEDIINDGKLANSINVEEVLNNANKEDLLMAIKTLDSVSQLKIAKLLIG